MIKAPKLKTLSAKKVKYDDMDGYDPRPTLYFTEEQFPQIKDWKPGEDYEIVLKVKMTNRNISQDENKKRSDAGFRVLEVGTYEEAEEKEEETPGYKKGGFVKKMNKLKNK